MKISGIAFDNDGVLVDTEPIQWKGWVHVLSPFNVTFTKDDYIEHSVGHTTGDIANYLRRPGIPPVCRGPADERSLFLLQVEITFYESAS